MDGALPRFSAPGWLLWRGIFQFLGLWEATPLSAFRRIAAGALGNVRGRWGRGGTAARRRAITFLGRHPPARKICLVPSLAAALGRGGESTKATPALETAPLPALLPAPRCTPAGKMASALQEQNNPAFELAVWALKNDLPRTKNCPRLTSQARLSTGAARVGEGERGPGSEQSPTVRSAGHRDDPFPKELTARHHGEKNLIIDRLMTICQSSHSLLGVS